MLISIITPIYNRANLLKRVYESLLNQTNKCFEWIIIDDGSTDNLKEQIDMLSHDDNEFPLRYFYKENGGKHTALNIGFLEANFTWCLVLDSDDWLVHTAIDDIKNAFNNSNLNPSGYIFLKSYATGELIGEKINNEGKLFAPDLINMKGDKAFVVKTDLIKNIRFPEFKGEKFVTESFLWNKCFDNDNNYALGVNKSVYIAEYLPGGLTANYYTLLKNNLNGTLSFVMSNLQLNSASLPAYKQAAYHFIPIARFNTLRYLYKRLGFLTFIRFNIILAIMFVKVKLREK